MVRKPRLEIVKTENGLLLVDTSTSFDILHDERASAALSSDEQGNLHSDQTGQFVKKELTEPGAVDKIPADATKPAGEKKVENTAALTVKHPHTGEMMLTREGAKQVEAKFKELGGFSRIESEMFGFNTGAFTVSLWSVNAKTGNRGLTSVNHVPKDDKEYELIKKTAQGKANKADEKALARMKAEREMNKE